MMTAAADGQQGDADGSNQPPPGGGAPVRQARTSAGGRADPGLARQLSELARALQADVDGDALLRRVVAAAIAEVPGATHAGVTLLDGGQLTTVAASDPLVERVDHLQYAAWQGPCVTASRDHVTTRSDDLAADDRWPEFGTKVASLGIRSMLSFQLFVERDSFGALNLYSASLDGFDDADENIGLLLASHAAVAMAGSRREADLRVALTSRDLIGQAKGILMERFRISDVQAFDLLVMASQRTNRKLRDVAEQLAVTGELAPPAGA